jgi:predicted cupin superfamily sugar epimerase
MTADDLIARFDLQPHPEGGWYRRLHTSGLAMPVDGRNRPAITAIVYLLRAGELSRWHRIFSDELWHFYGGAPLQLRVADAQLREVRDLRLGPVSEHGAAPMHAVPAGYWQAARSSAAANGYSLMGCTVAPGFDFADFRLLADDPAASMQLRAAWPHLADWL